MRIPTRYKLTHSRTIDGGDESSVHAALVHHAETPSVSEVIGLGSKRQQSEDKKRKHRYVSKSRDNVKNTLRKYPSKTNSEQNSSESNDEDLSDESPVRRFQRRSNAVSASTFKRGVRDSGSDELESDSDDTLSQDPTSADDESEQPDVSDDQSGDDATSDDADDDVVSNSRTVIYFRPRARISNGKRSSTKTILSADYPDASIVLESASNITKAPYASCDSLNRLMNRVFDQAVDQILVADSNHICSTKDAFQLFCWVCDSFGTKVLVTPGLLLP